MTMKAIDNSIRDAAHQWRSRVASGGMSEDERTAFENWRRADQRHFLAYERADMLWQGLDDVEGLDELEPLDRPLLRERLIGGLYGIGDLIRRPVVQFGAVAVAGLLMFAILSIETALPPITADHVTEVAEIRELTLPDGSRVTLGAQSAIEVNFEGLERHIILTAGEAFFDVEHDTSRPFIVEIDGTRVRVVGTKFEVHRGVGEVRVSVLEGLVQVEHGQENIFIKPGEEIIALRAGPLQEIRNARQPRPAIWREGRLVYVGAPLAEVIADANRYYDGTIEISSQELKDLKVTLAFRTNQIDEMLNTLTEALPVEATRLASGKVLITREKN